MNEDHMKIGLVLGVCVCVSWYVIQNHSMNFDPIERASKIY